MDNSSHTGRDDSDMYAPPPRGRASFPVSTSRTRDDNEIPHPTQLGRQVSLDSGRDIKSERARSVERMDPVADMSSELLEMQEFLEQLEGMDKHQVQEIIASEQAAKLARNSRCDVTLVDDR